MTLIKTQKSLTLLLVASLALLFWLSLPLLPQARGDLIGVSYNTTITRVNITNAPPFVSNVSITSPIDLQPNATALVHCNATVQDYNGFVDIANVNATLFQYSLSGPQYADHNRTHYSNTTCINVSSGGTVSNFSCTFNVLYYANNGTWTCNLTAKDNSSIQHSAKKNSSINTLIALTVPSLIDYGQVAVTNTSSNIAANLSNVGNKDINITVIAYANSTNDTLALVCAQGNISFDNQRYSLNGADAFNSRAIVPNNVSAQISGLRIAQRNNSEQESINTTNWMLTVPVGPEGTPYGQCNGTIVFTAIQANTTQ